MYNELLILSLTHVVNFRIQKSLAKACVFLNCFKLSNLS